MATSVDNRMPHLQVLDLRHYSATSLRPVLDAEGQVWSERLRWDYGTSIKLLLQYLDARVLPGFVAVEDGRVIGFAFCVYEERKAVIGDVFALSDSRYGYSQTDIESQLLDHLFSLLQHSPGVERIEIQMLLHPQEVHAPLFRQAGFSVFRRVFMELEIEPATSNSSAERQHLQAPPAGLEMRRWHDTDFNAAAALIAESYRGHLDACINEQYCSVAGSLRFLHNIIRFPGCGIFDPEASHVLAHAESGALAGIVLCSNVREEVEHITQLCVAPDFRGLGAGTLLLRAATGALAARGFRSLSLTVTEGNDGAIALYRRVGFVPRHTFDAMVWTRTEIATQSVEQLCSKSHSVEGNVLA